MWSTPKDRECAESRWKAGKGQPTIKIYPGKGKVSTPLTGKGPTEIQAAE
jgi:hypothetical protein